MIATNLILIDGFPGAGKSTTTQLLGLHLLRLGYPVHWFLEADTAHPIMSSGQVLASRLMTFTEGQPLYEQAFDRWKHGVADLRGTAQIVILEGVLFQNLVGSFFLMDAPHEAIVRSVQQVCETIQPLQPVLIYLYPGDASRALRLLAERRSAEFIAFMVEHLGQTSYGKRCQVQDFQGVLATFETLQALTDQIFAGLPLPKLAIDTLPGDWPHYFEQMTDWLALPPPAPIQLPFDDLAAFAGTYRAADSGAELPIVSDRENVYLGKSLKFRLLHIADLRFYLEGLPGELVFERDENGMITQFTVCGGLSELNTMWQKQETNVNL